mmetsp:Transcript_114646/g.357077  ORF Transcript_114646/g.357077 Transcript_114646/m.357077 type:complete len:103 (+) Transcript_114646:3-311(+)
MAVAPPQPRPAAAHPAARPAVRARVAEDELSAVVRSWEHVQALGTYSVGEMLYRHTFELEPEVMELFPVEVRLKYPSGRRTRPQARMASTSPRRCGSSSQSS